MPHSHERLETAVRALPLAVVVVDERGAVTLANARAVELLSVREGDDAPAFLHDVALRAGVRAGLVQETIEVATQSGASVAIEIRATPVEEGVVYAIDDLNERARRERADREFITNAAHQLRTPITAIATAIEVLQNGAKESQEPRDRFLGHIEQQTERLVRLARAMLTLSRAERGDIGPSLGVVPLRPILDGLVVEIPGRRGVDIEVECAPTAAAIADDALLSEALTNVLGNALDHTTEGSVRIAVADQGNGTIAIEVVDTGEGIAAAELPRVFERFHRGTSSGDGAGLGLPIARAAIRAMGGTLELESERGRGTTVCVLLRTD
jgi:two-component system, OmpR family, phosphate regulon sensor histidine kinase PhoR